MGTRRPGLVRAGFRRAGAPETTSAATGAVGWIADVSARMIDTLGLDPALAVIFADDFIAPGGGGAAGTDFGQMWTVVPGVGALIAHATSSGAVWPGGCCVIQQNVWTANYIESAGPGLTKGIVGDTFGFACRVYRPAGLPPNPFNNSLWGVRGEAAARLIFLGVDEATDTTHLCIGASGSPTTATSYLTAGIETAFREAMFLVSMVAGTWTAIAYMDGVEIGRLPLTSGITHDQFRVYIGANIGIYVWDAVCMVVPGATV